MADYSELKQLAEGCGNLNWRFQQENWTEYAIRDDHGYIATMRVGSPRQAGPDPDREAKARFLGAMTPGAVLALIAENERLSAQVRLAGVAAEMAVHDTAGRAATEYLVVAQERDQLKAEIAGLKTGYEAYEQVNSGLKTEIEALRKSRVPAGLYRELVTLRGLRDQAKAYVDGYLLDEVEDADCCVSKDQHLSASALSECLMDAFEAHWDSSMGKGEQS